MGMAGMSSVWEVLAFWRRRGAGRKRERGRVRWFSNSKGYGFIGRKEGEDVFVHYSEITGSGYKTLREGDEVEFEVVRGKKGLQATKVTRVKQG